MIRITGGADAWVTCGPVDDVGMASHHPSSQRGVEMVVEEKKRKSKERSGRAIWSIERVCVGPAIKLKGSRRGG